MTRPPRLRALAAAAFAAAVAAPPAMGGSVTVVLDPPLTDGVTGANGWYRVPVTATYTCTPEALETAVSCPPGEVFGDAAGTDPSGATQPITRVGAFRPVAGQVVPVSIVLESAPGVPLRVDTQPPPAPVITQPSLALVVRPGQGPPAAYACSFAGDRSGAAPSGACTGTVPEGQPIPSGGADPATWGATAFSVTARDAAGNLATTAVGYSIEPAPVAAQSTPPVVPPPRATARTRVRNARALRPAPGSLVAPRAVLRWRRAGGATLYNVQVFRIMGARYVKVLSAFPRQNLLRLPAGRVTPGSRYVWRVWVYDGRLRRYGRAPMGVSWFRAVPAPRG